jgi:hypothetical protein
MLAGASMMMMDDDGKNAVLCLLVAEFSRFQDSSTKI